jgi:hypothetical protein
MAAASIDPAADTLARAGALLTGRSAGSRSWH